MLGSGSETTSEILTKKAGEFPKWVDMAASRLASRNPDQLLSLIKDRKIPDSVRERAIPELPALWR